MKSLEALRKKTRKYFRKEHTQNQTAEEIIEFEKAQKILEKKFKQDLIHNNFMAFVKEMWPEFIEGRHHKEIADKFDKIHLAKLKD